jgi:hypothetical protein
MAENVTTMNRAPAVRPAAQVPKGTISRKDRRASKALRRQAGAALGLGAVAVTLTALSLSHLAHGIEIVTGCQPWEGWAMAVGIDLGFVALELSQLAVADKLRRQVFRFARPAILGTLVGSAGMNAFAFGAQAVNKYMMAAGIALGVAIPALIYALTRVGAALATDCHARA